MSYKNGVIGIHYIGYAPWTYAKTHFGQSLLIARNFRSKVKNERKKFFFIKWEWRFHTQNGIA
jgi:hypothetical protein